MNDLTNRPPDERRPIHLTRGKCGLVLEVNTDTGANQLLSEIATLLGVDLGARVIEELVFYECAEFRSPIVICAGNNLPGEIGVTSPSASAKAAIRALEVGAC